MRTISRAIALTMAAVLALPVLGNETALDSAERPLPEFELPALDASAWQPERLEGRPWVINFWATWCPPCIEEIPAMNRAWQALEPQGVGMLAINAGEGEAAVQAFMQKVAIDFPVLLGATDTLANWKIRALPTTLVIDASGQVVYEALGPREWDDEALLQQVLALRP